MATIDKHFYLRADTVDLLKKVCQLENRSQSNLVDEILRKGLVRRETNPYARLQIVNGEK